MTIEPRWQDALDAAFSAGRTGWPGILCSRQQFHEWALRNGIDADRLEAYGADLYLARACASGDLVAIAAFDRIYLTRVRPLIGGITLTSDDLTELRQQLRIKLLVGDKAKIGLYRGQGALWAWVQVCATRAALNLKRDNFHQALAGVTALENLSSHEPNAELSMVSMQSRNALNAALRRCLTALSAKEKALLQMAFVDGLNIDQIGVAFGVHRATIARWIAVIRSRILAEVCQSVAADLRTSRSEVLSLMGLARSEIDIGVGTILVNGGDAAPRNQIARAQAA